MTREDAERIAVEVWQSRPIGATLEHITDRIAAALLAKKEPPA